MPPHWTEKLFVEESSLFRTTIEARQKTQTEVTGLIELFNKHEVPENGLILDLACGIGRISIPLAKNGYNVVGIDLSPLYIKRATEYAEEEGVSDNTRFIAGDMRTVSTVLSEYVDSFDAVLNMWTSMGYWDETTDSNILRGSLRLTKLRSCFIMHTVSRDGLIKRFHPRSFSTNEEGLLVLIEQEFNLETSRMINHWTYYKREGEDLRYLKRVEINHRVYALHELKKQFQDSGWSYIESYGGFDMRPLTSDTFSLIIIARKQ